MLAIIWQIAIPIYAALVGIFVPVLITYLVKLARDKIGIEIEATHREALQSALTNAALTAVRHAGTNAVTSAGTAAAKEYVRRSVPDALKRFDVTDEMLDQLLAPKLEQVTGTILRGSLGR